MRHRGIRRGVRRALVVLLVLPLLAATVGGCGSGGAGDAIGTALASPAVSLRVPGDLDVGGCGLAARTDPDDVAADRVVARCTPGAPRPRPLAERARLVVGIQRPGAEVEHLLVAAERGELAAENVDVEVVEIPDVVELWDALATGEVDVVAGDLDAPFFDVAAEGSGARVVLGGPVARAAGDRSVPQAGLWVRDDALSRPGAWGELHGQRVAVGEGPRDVAVWPIDNALRQVDLSVDGTDMVTVAGEAAAARLLSAQVAAAWLDDTAARRLDGMEGFSLVATPPMVESLGGVVVAGRLVDPARDRDVGLALVRALIRTINTHLAGDSGRYVHDWELRSGTTERMQGSFVWLGSVRYDRVIPESRLVDRSLYEEAVDRDQDQG